MKIKLALLLVILFGFVIRIYNLSNNPAGFFCDEASIGYNAYTILTKGVDEYGVRFPFFFRAFGEYKSPIQIYSTVPLIAIFGLNEFSTRLTSVLYGSATILVIYLLTLELFKKNRQKNGIAILSSTFLGFSPWYLHLSRIAFELTPFVFFTTLATYFFLKSLNNPKVLFLSTVFFAFSAYSYYPARIFVPLLVISIFFIFFPFLWKQKKLLIANLIIGFFLFLPLIAHQLSPAGFSRWQEVNIFSNPPQDTTITSHIVRNYLSNFSLDFLFFKGDSGMPGQFITRHSINGFGELYLLQFPLLLFGIFGLKYLGKQNACLFLAWFLFYPTGSMFTTDASVQATRSIIGIIPFSIFSAFGVFFILNYLSKTNKQILYVVISLIGIAFLFSVFQFENFSINSYPNYANDFWGWQYGPRDIMKYFLANKDRYDDLYMSGEFNGTEIFPKFYDPENSCQNKCKIGDFYRQPEIINPRRKQLFSLSPEYLEKSGLKDKFSIKQTIYYPNHTIAFYLGEVVR